MTRHAIPDAVLGSHIAILGKTGSGKTSTEKLAIEQVVNDGFRVCVLDSIKSDWWGITSSADGKRAGLPFKILGGPRGHVPLHSSAGKAIGQIVGSGKLPLSIIDMADFEAGGLQRFFIDFAPALLRSVRGVVYLVMEEAHEFAPKERSGIGNENMAIHWAKKLATAGRSKGIRLVVATQRVQSLHNALLGSCETMIAMRLTTPADQEPVIKWLRSNVPDKDRQGEIENSLSSLPTGTGWMCSGEAKIFEKIAFPKFKTYDNTATPTGDGAEIDVKTAPVDQDELRAIIGEAVKDAEANDPKALKVELAKANRRVAELERLPPQKDADRLYKDGYDTGSMHGFGKGKIEGYKEAIKDVAASYGALMKAVGQAKVAIENIERSGASLQTWLDKAAERQTEFQTAASEPVRHGPAVSPPRPVAPQPRQVPAPEGSNGAISPTTTKILAVIHRAHPVALSFDQAATRAGVSKRSSALRIYRQQVEQSEEVTRREDGRFVSLLGPSAAPGSFEDPVAEFCKKLPPSYAAMLRALDESGINLSREEIAAAAGVSPTSSGLGAGLRELIALGLAQESERGGYELHPDLRRG